MKYSRRAPLSRVPARALASAALPAPGGAATIAAMPRLRIRLLGGFGITTDGGEPLAFPGKRQRTLVAYLLLHPEAPSDRRHLAFLLWPDSTERQALTNLRQLVHEVRAILPEPDRFIEAGRQLVRWRADAPSAADVDELRSALRRASGAGDPVLDEAAALADAVARYTGDLLPESYEEWLEAIRRRLRDDVAAALRRLVDVLEARREYAAAVPHAARLVALAPLDEDATLALMRLHAAAGSRAGALDAYERCAERLRDELGVEPGAALRELHDRLRRGGSAADATPPPVDAPPFAFVGRTREWRRLVRAWTAASAAPAQEGPRLVLISGVAGIGKTRLAEELVRWADAQGTTTATSRCYGTVGHLPYATVADWLRTPPLRRAVATLPDPWRAELSSVLPERGEAARVAEQRPLPEARRRLFEAVARAIVQAPKPLILFVDDIQWADRDSLEWIAWLLRAGQPARPGQPAQPLLPPRVMLVATLRAGEIALEPRLDAVLAALPAEGRAEEIAREPLDAAETAALGAAAAGAELDERAVRELHDETEGHPLYIVERVRARQAETAAPVAAGDAPRSSLPQRVRAVIEYRLSQLSPDAREAVGVASAIGREFGMDVLADAGGMRDAEAAAALDELAERRIVRERGDGAYDFTHDRIREVAYATLSSARRRVLHRHIARAQIADGQPALTRSDAPGSGGSAASSIARHLEQGGLVEGAIPYYRSAAEHAMGIYASAEAVGHLEKSLALLEQLPATRARLLQEIDLRTALCIALVHRQHYGARVLAEYARIRALCDRAGSEPSAPALRALALTCIMRGEMAQAADIGQRLRAAAPPAAGEYPALLVEAEYLLGVSSFWLGRPVEATRHLIASLRAYRPEHAHEHINGYGQDAGAVCGVRLAQTLWMIGKPAPARRALERAVAWAEALGHPHTLAYVRQFAAWTLIDLGDEAAARREIDGAIALADANDLAGWWLLNEAIHGYLLAREGHVERGLETMRRAAREMERWSWRLAAPYHRWLLGRVCLEAGLLDEGLDSARAGMSAARETGQAFWDAELLRLEAELLVARGAPRDAVEAQHRTAREIASRQGAVALVRRG